MITFDSRMVHGYPLQYYSTHPVDPHHQYPYFKKYDYYSMADNSEELIMPSSPHSTQSDSDNSMSSTDVTAKSIIFKPALPTNSIKQDIKCAWFQCGLWFETLDLLANHVSKAHASSGPSGLFYCGWEGCTRNNKGFNARYKMLVHVRTHTNEKPHQCCQCEKSFSRAENLKIHSRSHSGEKPYLCPVPGCNKAYSNSSDRFKHTRTHQVEKPYLCKVPGCPKRYTDPSSLRKHVKTYKHFPYDPLKPDATQDTTVDTTKLDKRPNLNSKIEQFLPGDNLIKNSLYHENIINSHSCSCPHSCCLKTCLTEAAELLKFGALINFAGPNLETVTWNRFLDPSMQDKLKFGLYKDEQMDLDVPLDLTVHRK